ncbi:MAG: glycosyltransferase family A protein [Ginsengibacter sp.]
MMTKEIINNESAFPFFSVIITTYNRANILKRALDSLIAQTDTDWEAIIVDDGSTDDTAFSVLPYLVSGSKIKYFHQENAGYSSSKNTGILLSKGKFITFLDSDDEYSPTHLEERKVILMNDPGIEFLHGGLKVIGTQYVPDRFDFNKMILVSDCEIGGTFFIKREIAVSFNGFKDMPLGSDGDFFERIKNAGVSIMKIQNPTYIYHRESTDSITNNLMLKSKKF